MNWTSDCQSGQLSWSLSFVFVFVIMRGNVSSLVSARGNVSWLMSKGVDMSEDPMLSIPKRLDVEGREPRLSRSEVAGQWRGANSARGLHTYSRQWAEKKGVHIHPIFKITSSTFV